MTDWVPSMRNRELLDQVRADGKAFVSLHLGYLRHGVQHEHQAIFTGSSFKF